MATNRAMIMYDRTITAVETPSDIAVAISTVAVMVKIEKNRVAAIAHALWMPPMWKMRAQCRRIASGSDVGTEQKTVKSRFTTGSERMSTAMHRLDAVAVARSASTRLPCPILRYKMKPAITRLTKTTTEKNRR